MGPLRPWLPNLGWATLGSLLAASSVAVGLFVGSSLLSIDPPLAGARELWPRAGGTSRPDDASMSVHAPAEADWDDVTLQRPRGMKERDGSSQAAPSEGQGDVDLDAALPPGMQWASNTVGPEDADLPLPPDLLVKGRRFMDWALPPAMHPSPRASGPDDGSQLDAALPPEHDAPGTPQVPVSGRELDAPLPPEL